MEPVTKSDIDKNFGKVLRDFRVKNKLTQEQLSEALGISLKYISRIENGNNGVKTQTLINYMNILGITPDFLYKPFLTNKNVVENIEITEKIASLSEDKKQFIIDIIDLLNNLS
jgi:transcriptional regulator with XRE-family HTH domain